MQDKTLFIFDVDGTLVNAYGAIHKSLLYTRERYGLPPVTYKAAKMAVGRGDRRFIRSFFDEDDTERALKTFKKHHETAVLYHCKVLPFARYILFRLKQKGKRLAVATNRPRKFTHLILKGLDLKRYFDAILCADEVNAWKPDPKILQTLTKRFRVNSSKAVFIGDMDIDIETAKRAKMEAFFVKGGSSKLKDVKKYKNKRVIHNLKEILKHV